MALRAPVPLVLASPHSVPFSDADLQQLAQRGVSVDEARRQLQCFADGFAPARLDRAATLGDGIETLDDFGQSDALTAWKAAADAGELAKFVPASGAASRMFQFLLASLQEDSEARLPEPVSRVLDAADDFAFASAWRKKLEECGSSWPPTTRSDLALLLTESGLNLASWPKGLIDFHVYPEETRSAFAEHLHEATRLVADANGRCRVHFTVTASARAEIRGALEAVRAEGYDFELSDSLQEPATDTLAADLHGAPFRDDDGRLVFRAGGHGSLLTNLEAFARGAGAELLLLKNIDNIAREEVEVAEVETRRALVGTLQLLRKEARRHWQILQSSPDAQSLDAADGFCRERLHRAPTELGPAAICEVLDRPTRVCGMVRNEGEPGGGPFWVRDGNGALSLQIVEGSQIDRSDPEQAAILASATHFNPVDLVCALRSFTDGESYTLASYVDAAAGFISSKSFGGKQLQALERPGLWNGAMAGWNTIFVEVPLAGFNPVKTVLDLLRPAHRGPQR